MTMQSGTKSAAAYVDGEWREGSERIEITDLTDGTTFATVTASTPEDVTDALAAADGATRAMKDTTVVQRAAWVEAIADALRERKSDLAEVIVREAGKPISSARGEVDAAAKRFDRAAEEVRSLFGEYREGSTAGHEGWQAIVKPEPVGVVAAVAPYNYPLATTAQQVAPALAAGNTVVLKPASTTPIASAVLTEAVVGATDLPTGAFNYVPGHSSEIGDTLTGDERVDAVAMTGSTRAGKHIAGESQMVTLHLELGGNAPAVVFPDADITDAAEPCTMGSVKYGGQRCSAISRVLAHESVHDNLVAQMDDVLAGVQTGDLFDEATTFGPLITEGQAEWVEQLVDDAIEKGATVVRGGERDGAFFEPTLLADVPHDADIVREEQFGPVAAVTTFEDEAQALEIANDTDYALDASVFTSDYDRALRVADRIEAGAVRINGRPSHGIGDVPYGGNKDSGIGREGLHTSIEDLVTTKSIIL